MGKISESKIADLVKTRTKDFFNRFLDFIKNVIILFKGKHVAQKDCFDDLK